MVRLFKLRNYVLTGFLFLMVTIFPNSSFAGTTIDLVQCVDSTGSISESDFDLQIAALRIALGNHLPNGNVRLTLILLRGEDPDNTTTPDINDSANDSYVFFGPTLMTSGTEVTAADNALAAFTTRNSSGGTCLGTTDRVDPEERCCIDIGLEIINDGFNADTRILDLATDGLPSSNGNGLDTAAGNRALALDPSNNGIPGFSLGFTEVNSLATGTPDLTFLGILSDTVYDPGISSFNQAFDEKIEDEVPTPTGACCDEIGVTDMCEVVTQAICEGRGDTYTDDGLPCDENRCFTPIGACCTNVEVTDACEPNLSQAECDNESQNSEWQGAGQACEEFLCVDPQTPTGSTVIIPTMGQWGMLLVAVVLGIFAIIRLRSIKDSELS